MAGEGGPGRHGAQLSSCSLFAPFEEWGPPPSPLEARVVICAGRGATCPSSAIRGLCKTPLSPPGSPLIRSLLCSRLVGCSRRGGTVGAQRMAPGLESLHWPGWGSRCFSAPRASWCHPAVPLPGLPPVAWPPHISSFRWRLLDRHVCLVIRGRCWEVVQAPC